MNGYSSLGEDSVCLVMKSFDMRSLEKLTVALMQFTQEVIRCTMTFVSCIGRQGWSETSPTLWQSVSSVRRWKQNICILQDWNWENITIDIVLSFPLTLRKKDAIWMIVDGLTKEFSLPSSLHCLYIVKAGRVIHHRYNTTRWNVGFHYLWSGSSIYFEILEKFTRSLRFETRL